MDLKPAWYNAIEQRTSRRRFSPQLVPADLRERLGAFCAAESPRGEARAAMVADADKGLFTGVVGGYGSVTGTPYAAALIGAEGAEADAGYLGEALILEATTLGLGTCWIAGSFDRERAGQLVELRPGERVIAVVPIGYPTERQAGGERLVRAMVKASARHSVERIAPGILNGDWPRWTVAAVQAARLAPSGANRQPWRFRLDGTALAMSRAEKLYWTAPIDLGIARLHVELGAAHEGVRGSWEDLPAPDVALFTPAG